VIIRNDQCDVNEREQTLKVKYDLSYEKKIINQKHLNKNDRTTALHIFYRFVNAIFRCFQIKPKTVHDLLQIRLNHYTIYCKSNVKLQTCLIKI